MVARRNERARRGYAFRWGSKASNVYLCSTGAASGRAALLGLQNKVARGVHLVGAVKFTHAVALGVEAKEFLKAFKAKYNTVPVSVWAVLAGDAFKVVQGALEAGKNTPKAMAAWLKELKGMPGLSGNLGFNAKGDRVGEFYRTYKVDATGNFVLQPK